MFESFVNSEECKTSIARIHPNRLFESFVNSEECKTELAQIDTETVFESFVNSEECKTVVSVGFTVSCLRALLIQKSVKPPLAPSSPPSV